MPSPCAAGWTYASTSQRSPRFAHDAVADDAAAVANHARVPPEIEARPPPARSAWENVVAPYSDASTAWTISVTAAASAVSAGAGSRFGMRSHDCAA